jgi:hypothetical protein
MATPSVAILNHGAADLGIPRVRPSAGWYYIRLADIGIHGNSHVMMLEKNNKEVAGVIAAWLDKTVND